MLVEEFKKLHTEKKESLLLISHQERIIRMADRVMIIEGGQVTKCGPTEEILPYLTGEAISYPQCLSHRDAAL